MSHRGVFFLAAFSLLARGETFLMPQPARLSPGQGKLVIDQSFTVALSGFEEPRLRAAAARLMTRLSRQTGMPLPLAFASEGSRATLEIGCQRAAEPVQSPREDESYTLEVTPLQARIQAVTPVGALRGIETFLQLVEVDGDSFSVPSLRIEDRPRFPWRGLLLDVARHFMPVEVLERNIDGMAAVKLNVLHLHLSDDQGFRVESKALPKLHQMGSDGQYYTQDQVRHIVAYARERGVRVIPEFEMPGHSTSLFVGYPELASAPGPFQLERTWGVHGNCINPTREETYTFLDTLVGEMSGLFPDEYFHIGGDEVNGKQWTANASVMAFERDHGMKSHQDLQAYFNQRLEKILTRYGKKMVGWDEILHPDLPKNIVVHSWRGQKSLAQAARQGYTGILSFGYYLDLIQPASQHYAVDPMDKDAATLSAAERERILGGEACMWSEYVGPETLDSRVWPRTAAIAERLWSPQDVKDVASMYARLEQVSRKLEWLGLTHRSGYGLMLQRLAGSDRIGPLKTLADVLEPVKGYARGRAYKPTQQMPFNRLVDAARPESDLAREFQQMVDRALSSAQPSPEELGRIRALLAEWRDNDARLAPTLERSFLLREAIPLSRNLSSLAAAGLEAVDALRAGKRPAEQWLATQTAVIERARQPQADLLLMIVPSVRKLVEAAAKQP